MLQADLAGKEFTAEKQQVIVISTGNNKAMTAKDKERNALERRAAEQRHEHRCAPRITEPSMLLCAHLLMQLVIKKLCHHCNQESPARSHEHSTPYLLDTISTYVFHQTHGNGL